MAFADEILEITDGAGVDVILNSFAGEAITRGVQILAPGGRFVELGKKDVYADASLGLAALAKSASFSVVDLDLNLRMRPQRYNRMLKEILARAAAGDLEPFPVSELRLRSRHRRIPTDGLRRTYWQGCWSRCRSRAPSVPSRPPPHSPWWLEMVATSSLAAWAASASSPRAGWQSRVPESLS